MSRLPLHRCFPPEPNEVVRDVSIAELTQKWPEKHETFYVRVSPAEVVPRVLRRSQPYPSTECIEAAPTWDYLSFIRDSCSVQIGTKNAQGRTQNVCFEDAPYVAAQMLRARAGLYIVQYHGATYMEKPLDVTFTTNAGIHAMGQNMLAIAPLLNRDGDHAIGMRIRRFYFDFRCVGTCPLAERERISRELAYTGVKTRAFQAAMALYNEMLHGEEPGAEGVRLIRMLRS